MPRRKKVRRLTWQLLLFSGLLWLWPAALCSALDMQTIVGHYYLRGVHEMGSELLLKPDGHFEYFLAYGAYDENAAGDWRLNGNGIILNTSGGYTEPRFILKQNLNKPGQPLTIRVEDQNGRGIPGIDVLVDYGGAKPERGYTQYYGWQARHPDLKPQAIGLGVMMYNLQPKWFNVADKSTNYYVFTFNSGDLGKVLFRNELLRWDNGALIMERWGRKMRYIKRMER